MATADGRSYALTHVAGRKSRGITGDAAGLATRDMCEGIGPAIRSGHRAAAAILRGAPYTLDDVTGASLGGGIASRLLDWAFTRGVGSSVAA